MRVRRYLAVDLREALRLVQEDMGPQAVVLETRRLADGIEIVATLDHAEAEAEHQARLRQREQARRMPAREHEEERLLPDWVRQDLAAPVPAKPPRPELRVPRQVEAVIESPARKTQGATASRRDQQLAGLREHLSAAGEAGEDVAALKAELAALRAQVQGLRKQGSTATAERGDGRARVMDRLQGLGFSPALVEQLLQGQAAAASLDKLWQGCLGRLAKSLRIEADPELIERAGVQVMLGPTGAGKTTTLAKLAARYVIAHGADSLALLSTDSYRVGSYEQLEKIAAALGVRSALVEPGDRVDSVIASLGRRRLVLVDTAGFSRQAPEHLAQQQMLGESRYRMQAQLVLPANLHGQVLQRTYEDFSGFHLSGAIISKVDEASSLGEVLSLLVQTGLPVTYWTHGQRIPEDIERPSAARLVSMAVAMAPRQQAARRVEEMPASTGRMAKLSHN